MSTRAKKPTVELNAWRNAIHRCHNENHAAYPDYGGRGIKVCDEWRDEANGFDNFLDHIGMKPTKELSLDRIDNNRGYEPGNVRWATRAQQQANRRTENGVAVYNRKCGLRLINCKGELLRPSEISKRTGVSITKINKAFREGTSGDKIIELRPRFTR